MPSTPRIIADGLWPGAAVERSIFGTGDAAAIWRSVREEWPEVVDCFAFEVSVGALLGVVLDDGSRAALKVHRQLSHEELCVVQDVQRRLHDLGFPAPRPLGVRGRTTLEEWVEAGKYRDAHEPPVRTEMARLLAELHRLTGSIASAGAVTLPVGGSEDALWPPPHSVVFEFGRTGAGAEWIDDIARAAKRALAGEGSGRSVVSHADWSVKHLRFADRRVTVVYDWDSLRRGPEPVVVGHTAATFTYTERLAVDRIPSVEEARAFAADYEAARGRTFDDVERRTAFAAAVYSRAYGARCAYSVGALDRSASRLEEYAAAFL